MKENYKHSFTLNIISKNKKLKELKWSNKLFSKIKKKITLLKECSRVIVIHM